MMYYIDMEAKCDPLCVGLRRGGSKESEWQAV